LEEFLEPLGVTPESFRRAPRLDVSYARLNAVINALCQVSADSALALGEAPKAGPEFWLNLQRDRDLWHAVDSHRKVPPLQKVRWQISDSWCVDSQEYLSHR
jgi:addiction module HigA family antidote